MNGNERLETFPELYLDNLMKPQRILYLVAFFWLFLFPVDDEILGP